MNNMKRAAVLLLALIMLLSLCSCGNGNAAGQSATADEAEQTAEVTEAAEPVNATYLYSAGNTYREYLVLTYDKDTRVLQRLRDITHFDKAAYTPEKINEIDVDSIFNGFSTLGFTEKELTEEEDNYHLELTFNDLGNEENMKQMVENGLISFEDDSSTLADADSYMEMLEESGAILLGEKDSLMSYVETDDVDASSLLKEATPDETSEITLEQYLTDNPEVEESLQSSLSEQAEGYTMEDSVSGNTMSFVFRYDTLNSSDVTDDVKDQVADYLNGMQESMQEVCTTLQEEAGIENTVYVKMTFYTADDVLLASTTYGSDGSMTMDGEEADQ